jgi:hypothetical protein
LNSNAGELEQLRSRHEFQRELLCDRSGSVSKYDCFRCLPILAMRGIEKPFVIMSFCIVGPRMASGIKDSAAEASLMGEEAEVWTCDWTR